MFRELRDAEEISAAKYEIELWLLDRSALVLHREDLPAAALTDENFAFTYEFGKLIFSYWTEDAADSKRVAGYRIEPDALILQIAAPFKIETHILVLAEPDNGFMRDRKEQRKDYSARLRALIEKNLSAKVLHARVGRNDSFGYGASVVRMALQTYDGIAAAVGTSAREDSAAVARLLGQGMNWLIALRKRLAPKPVNRLMIFAPSGRADLLAERLTLVRAPAADPDQNGSERRIELFEVDEKQETIESVRPFDQGDLGLRIARTTRLPKAGRIIDPAAELRDEIEWIEALAPDAIETRMTPIRDRMKIEINGLEIARAHCGRRPRIEFGIESRRTLSERNREELAELVKAVAFHRRAGASDRQHPFYRIAAESWLESILRRDITLLDPNLLPGSLYSQVPAIKQSGERFIDLLAARSDGRLVVIELKVSEEPELPFQGLDYWLRVEWHRARGDFTKRGYFREISIADAPALVYLAAPRLRFHKNFALLAGSIESRVPIFRAAINDNWRDGLKVHSIDRMN